MAMTSDIAGLLGGQLVGSLFDNKKKKAADGEADTGGFQSGFVPPGTGSNNFPIVPPQNSWGADGSFNLGGVPGGQGVMTSDISQRFPQLASILRPGGANGMPEGAMMPPTPQAPQPPITPPPPATPPPSSTGAKGGKAAGGRSSWNPQKMQQLMSQFPQMAQIMQRLQGQQSPM